jgi:hypothetical protein
VIRRVLMLAPRVQSSRGAARGRGPHTRQLIDIRVQRAQTSCGAAVRRRSTSAPARHAGALLRQAARRGRLGDAHLAERAKPQEPVAALSGAPAMAADIRVDRRWLGARRAPPPIRMRAAGGDAAVSGL